MFKCVINSLRGYLLEYLYPDHIGYNEIISYLVKEDPSFIGEYFRFIAHEIIEKTDPQYLVSLIDHAINSDIQERDSYLWQQFKGRLLLETLTYHGDKVEASKLYKWFGIAFDKRGFTKNIRREESSCRTISIRRCGLPQRPRKEPSSLAAVREIRVWRPS